MFNFESVTNLSVDNVIILNALKDIAEEAKAHSELIHQAYHCFGIGEDKVEVWHDKDFNNFEYLTYDGTWQARYWHHSYNVGVDANSIFDIYKAEYLIKNGYLEEVNENGIQTEANIKAYTAEYFRSFVARIEVENS